MDLDFEKDRAANAAKLGEDRLNGGDGPECRAKDGGYLCTKPRGHSGDCVAHGVCGDELHRWREGA